MLSHSAASAVHFNHAGLCRAEYTLRKKGIAITACSPLALIVFATTSIAQNARSGASDLWLDNSQTRYPDKADLCWCAAPDTRDRD